MSANKIISFPHMGNYHIPIKLFLKKLLPDHTILPAPKITKKTLEIGGRHSPDYVCSPFKYNLGNFIEALDAGANVLFQAGYGCLYGFYGEVQEQILRDLGYKFEFISLARDNAKIKNVYQNFKNLGCKQNFVQFINTLILALRTIKIMDNFENYIRQNAGYEVIPESFKKFHQQFLNEIQTVDSMKSLGEIRKEFSLRLKDIKVSIPDNPIRIGIVGELYTIMEPFSNHEIEKVLLNNNIIVSRMMNASFLLLNWRQNATLKKSKKYLKYTVGANGVDTIAQSISYAEKMYDGIIHMKSFGCAPELNVAPALINIGNDFDIPILSLSFDINSSEVGVLTRLEAFIDMIIMRKGRNNGDKSFSGDRYRLDFN